MDTSSFSADVGRTQFLQLLVSQLQYQDPLQPVEQQDFLTQLAQFSVLDGIEQMNVNFDDLIRLQSLSQGADLVGQEVRYNSDITGETLTGTVDEARIVDGKLIATINQENVPLANIIAIVAAPAA